MSASNNPNPHPDENVLTAFAEQTLPQSEREAVFSHLAGCSRCREVAFFAQEAGTTNEPKAATAPIAAHRLHWRRPAFAALGVAMIAGALLSWEYDQHAFRAQQEPPAKPAVPPATDQAKAVTPLAPAAVSRQEPGAVPALQREAKAKTEFQHVRPIPGKQANPSGSAARPESSQPTPSPLVAASLAGVATSASPAQAVHGQQGSLLAVRSGFVNLPSSPLAVGSLFRVRDGAVEAWDGSEYQTLSLPNGIKAASVAGRAEVVLALERDGAGVLYRSVDGGDHWTPVDTQWRGKAISVQIRRNNPTLLNLLPTSTLSAENSRTGSGISDRSVDPNLQQGAVHPPGTVHRPAPAVKAQPTSMPVIFELRNDAGEQWVSVDQGKTWQPE